MIYTFDEIKQMKQYALQKVRILQQQILFNSVLRHETIY